LFDASTNLLGLQHIRKALPKKEERRDQEEQPQEIADWRLCCAKDNSDYEKPITTSKVTSTVLGSILVRV
jgi:hypothetical protein